MAEDQPMWGNNRAVAPIPGASIIAVDLRDNFTIKDAIKLKLFPSSLAGDAKVWFNELSSGVITTWEEMRQAFDLLRSFHRLGLGRGTIIQIFYHGLDEATQAILDVGGIFLYKTPNKAHRLLEDRVLLKLDWSKDIKAKALRKTVAFAEAVEDHTHQRSVMTNPCEDLKMKKQTIPTEVIDEDDIEETTTRGKTYDPLVNPNDKTTIIHDDTEDEADEAKRLVGIKGLDFKLILSVFWAQSPRQAKPGPRD
ncbi:hypothetical protein Tco_0650222 [Tanacetum coccineum]